jgi:hypothetical protein
MRALLVAGLAAAAAAQPSFSTPPLVPFRPPAVPLLTQSPYISVWSPADALTGASTEHWSGAASTLVGLLRVDGNAYTWLGPAKELGIPPASQLGWARVGATTTTATFVAGGVLLNVSFTSPLLPSNRTLLATPASYISLSAASADGNAHSVQLYFDFDATLVTNNTHDNSTLITWLRVDDDVGPGVAGMRVGAAQQYPLNPIVCGQSEPLTASQTIVWGWAYLLASGGAGSGLSTALTGTVAARAQFAQAGTIPAADDPAPPKAVGDGFVGPVALFDLGSLPGTPGSPPHQRALTFFMDEILAASYYHGMNSTVWEGNPDAAILSLWWRKDLPFNDTTGVPGPQLRAAHDSYAGAVAAAEAFDAAIFARLEAAGDANLATFASLVYRQVLAANVLAYHPNRDELWVIFKEIASGGDFSTVDVVFPASPLLAVLAPDLLGASIIPLLRASFNETIYKKAWVIHDIGKFPIADRPDGGQEDMPVEETANVLLIAAAISMFDGGNVTWLSDYAASPGGLQRWADFLVASLPFLPKQGNTDDFLGEVANGTNLCWKAAAGLAAYGYLAWQGGNQSGAAVAWEAAGYAAALLTQYGWWEDGGETGVLPHFLWGYGFNSPAGGNSTFLQYNALWAPALRMYTLAPNQTGFLAAEADYYATIAGDFGVPLINGSTGTKGDWLHNFAAALYRTPNSSHAPGKGVADPFVPQPVPYSHTLFAAALAAANATSARTPMTDFWSTHDASYGGKYRARPVLGATFAPLLVVELAALPPMPHEAPMAAAFAQGHQRAAREIRGE